MIVRASPQSTATVPLVTGVALVAAMGLRVLIGGSDPAASIPAAIAFAAALLGISVAAGWRPRSPSLRNLLLGAAAAEALIGIWLVARPSAIPLHSAGLGALVVWTPAVTLVAMAEEVLLRGALFSAITTWRGPTAALVVTSAAFALIHVPLYGLAAVPVDLTIGVCLGGLRMATGSVAAPAVAHAALDLAGGWLG